MTDQFSVVLLAAQRTGVVNPLAKRHGVSHKCLIPIVGTPLIERVLDTLVSHSGCREILVLIERDGMAEAERLASKYSYDNVPIRFHESSANIADSVLTGCAQSEGPWLITTADNVLLHHDTIDRVMAEYADGAEGALVLARKGDVRAIHPEAQGGFYDLRDDGYANCNTYMLANAKALAGVEMFRSGGQFMRNPKRLIEMFGLFNILLVRFRLISLERAMRRLSRHFGIEARAVVTPDGSQAIDVDNERTYRIVEGVLTGEFSASR